MNSTALRTAQVALVVCALALGMATVSAQVVPTVRALTEDWPVTPKHTSADGPEE